MHAGMTYELLDRSDATWDVEGYARTPFSPTPYNRPNNIRPPSNFAQSNSYALAYTPPEGSYWRSSHAGSDSWHQGDRENQRDWYDNDHRTPYERLCDEVPDDRKVWVRMPWIQSRTSFEQRRIDEGYARYERNASRRLDTDYQREYQGRSSSDHDSNQYPSSSWSHQTTLQPINSELEW